MKQKIFIFSLGIALLSILLVSGCAEKQAPPPASLSDDIDIESDNTIVGDAIKKTVKPKTPVVNNQLIVTNGKTCKVEKDCAGFAWSTNSIYNYEGKSVCKYGYCILRYKDEKTLIECKADGTIDLENPLFASRCDDKFNVGRYYSCQPVYTGEGREQAQRFCVEKPNLPKSEGTQCIIDNDCILKAGGDYRYGSACRSGLCAADVFRDGEDSGALGMVAGCSEENYGVNCVLQSNVIDSSGSFFNDRRFTCGRVYNKENQPTYICLEPWK